MRAPCGKGALGGHVGHGGGWPAPIVHLSSDAWEAGASPGTAAVAPFPRREHTWHEPRTCQSHAARTFQPAPLFALIAPRGPPLVLLLRSGSHHLLPANHPRCAPRPPRGNFRALSSPGQCWKKIFWILLLLIKTGWWHWALKFCKEVINIQLISAPKFIQPPLFG